MITPALTLPGAQAPSTGSGALAPVALPGGAGPEPSFGSELRRANLHAARAEREASGSPERGDRGKERIAARRSAMPSGAAARSTAATRPDSSSAATEGPHHAASSDPGLAEDTKADHPASADLSSWVAGLVSPQAQAVNLGARTAAGDSGGIATSAVAGQRSDTRSQGIVGTTGADRGSAARGHRSSPAAASALTSEAAGSLAAGSAATDAAADVDVDTQGFAATRAYEPAGFVAASADSRAAATTSAATTATGIAGAAGAAPVGLPSAVETAAGVQISPTLGSPEFAPALGTQIVVLVRQGIEQARLQLNPAEMGPIAVQLALEGNTVRIEMIADQGATRTLLEQSLPTLAASLRDAGFTLGGGGVFGQARDGGAGHDGAPAAAHQQPASAVADAMLPAPRLVRSQGLVDTYA